MKKLIFGIITTCLLLIFSPFPSNAATYIAASSSATAPVESAEAKKMVLRLNEINSIDKSKLNPSEKKSLRKEVLSIKKYLIGPGGGVYISVGSIIIIALLLIILL